ncbi:hypothetical protein KIN20_006655 [Parelaphostrongylus tenuis]|uniref:Rho GDP-dissociation inhibitor 3 n=1 Tax=Parelaphostrongylus tenuis TaxID=148309 RepID=A0AAD5M231_PARTN|nr:hypothetical protein KIN20_006655 [Parelaphostrongylus tenuis]
MTENVAEQVVESIDDEHESQYRPPEKKTMAEILNADQEDESLAKYKATLLGSSPANVIVDENNPKVVIVKSITLLVDGREDITMDLSDHGTMEDRTFVLKEGCQYRLRFNFYVQREIVTGLKYIHKVSRHGVQVLKETFMVGSYGPKKELQSYTTPVEEAPAGLLHRGRYKVKSQMTDDDGHDWLTWTWTTDITKEW